MNQRYESIDGWAKFIRENNNWKDIHTEFINSQFQKHEEILKKLSPEKIIEIYKIKNKKGYKKLLNLSK